jgi:glucose uptake protein GlcU
LRRRSVWAARLLPVAAGAAFALSAITTKLLTDAGTGAPATVAFWLATTAAVSGIGAVDELSAFRTAGASTVAPVVLATETLIPVALAPVIFGETWPESAARRAGLAIAILAVVGGAVVLGRARGFAAVVDEHHAVGESSCEQAVSANQRS